MNISKISGSDAGRYLAAFMSLMCLLLPGAYAEVAITKQVSGQSAPWVSNQNLNAGFPFGVVANGTFSVSLPPTAFTKLDGSGPNHLQFYKGHVLSIRYTPVSTGDQILVGSTANTKNVRGSGGLGVLGTDWPPYNIPCSGAPGCRTGQTTILGQLIGSWAKANGEVIGIPFIVGNGTDATMPEGTEALLLGINDEWYTDNGGDIFVTVSESNPCAASAGDITLNVSHEPALILPVTQVSSLIQLQADAAGIGASVTSRHYGFTAFIIDGKNDVQGVLGSAGLPEPHYILSESKNGDSARCFYYTSITVNFPGHIVSEGRKGDVNPDCARLTLIHEKHHQRDKLTSFLKAIQEDVADFTTKLPSASRPLAIAPDADMPALAKRLINDIINQHATENYALEGATAASYDQSNEANNARTVCARP